MASQPLSSAAIALNRFGLGARPDENPPADPKAWLKSQLDRFEVRPAAFAALSNPAELLRDLIAGLRQSRAQAQSNSNDRSDSDPDMRKAARRNVVRDVQAEYRDAVDARAAVALTTDTPFVERLVHFWSNHFAVSADNPQVTTLAGSFEADAIRPHVLGRFEDMLMAVERHPAMLMYLNQARSVGPDSQAALRRARFGGDRQPGLNENLGREIMELHTLGVRSGYTQADVTEFARALTGWTIAGPGLGRAAVQSDNLGFVFRSQLHEPGTRSILGRRYAQPGEGQAAAALADFAASPATATHVATKLARHFAGDTPPPALVARLSDTFTQSRGDLPSLYKTLIDSPEPWDAQPLKFKTPWEWTISALRGLGRGDAGRTRFAPVLTQLGQPVWRPGSPAGWDDIAAAWAAPDALVRRVEFADRLAAATGDRVDPRELGDRLFPGSFDPATAAAIGRAESKTGGLALLLVAPVFLRR